MATFKTSNFRKSQNFKFLVSLTPSEKWFWRMSSGFSTPFFWYSTVQGETTEKKGEMANSLITISKKGGNFKKKEKNLNFRLGG